MDNFNGSYQSMMNTDLTQSQVSDLLARIAVLEAYFAGDAEKLVHGDGSNNYPWND